MGMEMRAKEDIEIAVDLIPPIPPLSFSLHRSLLHSHCSACFSLLPSPPLLPLFLNNSPHVPTLFYCSPQCSASDSALHFFSAEHHLLLLLQSRPSPFTSPSGDSSDLRAALRFLHSQRASLSSGLQTGRLAGLLVNRERLLGEDDELSENIRIGARAMATAIMMQCGGEELDNAVVEEATMALSLVLTNSVEVQDNEGRTMGIAIYDPTFCWINHSCSPNACYRFTLSSSPNSLPLLSEEMKLRIAPFTHDSKETKIDSGFYGSSSELAKERKLQGYGPRIIVRSIKRIKKGEEVTVTYTDLLQPKAMRQLELWSRYRFICCCRRCNTLPFTYVDHALQEIFAMDVDSSGLCSNYKFCTEKAISRLTEYIDDVISEYLTIGNPGSCCEKLESILTQGLKELVEGNEGKSLFTFKLHPLHHLSLNVYTTLASAYKVRGSDLLSLNSEIDGNKLEAFDMSRTSAAYSLVLAGATHHLFHSESSLIASAANFWIGAGESLLFLARSSGWSAFAKLGQVNIDLPFVEKFKCSKCSLMDRFRACLSNGQLKSADFEDVSSQFLHCVTNITHKVWSFLVYSCKFLGFIEDPINFSWLVNTKNSNAMELRTLVNRTDKGPYHESGSNVGLGEEQCYTDHGRVHIFQLGVHCLAYGGILANICYGPHSHLVCLVLKFIDHEGNFKTSFFEAF